MWPEVLDEPLQCCQGSLWTFGQGSVWTSALKWGKSRFILNLCFAFQRFCVNLCFLIKLKSRFCVNLCIKFFGFWNYFFRFSFRLFFDSLISFKILQSAEYVFPLSGLNKNILASPSRLRFFSTAIIWNPCWSNLFAASRL